MASDESSNGRDAGDYSSSHSGAEQGSERSEDNSSLGNKEPPRREVEIDESDYEPESPNEDEDGNPLPPNEDVRAATPPRTRLIKPEHDEEDGGLLARVPPSSPRWSPFKRPAEAEAPGPRPFKRARGDFRHQYLNLLNADIEDAAVRFVPHGQPSLGPSQIGLTMWTPLEKDIFFEALSRLGRDGIPEIARRIRSKSELEILQYLKVLDDGVAARDRNQELEPLFPVDFPAAVEISPMCCNALEEAADAISIRQEQHEEACEERRWEGNWLITPFNHKHIESAKPPNLPSVELFRASSWLRLAERIFMNASFPENNWAHVADDNPSIRATAFEDFYSLAVSITKRLVATTIYVSESRIRAKRDLYPNTRPLIWPKDVEAAALSIGLKTNSRKFWAGCSRRLRLAVFDDDDDVDETEENILSYDDVEAALGGSDEGAARRPEAEVEESDDDLMSISDTPSIEDVSGDEGVVINLEGTPESAQPNEPPIDEEEIRRESMEIQLYTAMDLPKTTRTRQTLESRIKAELRHVAYADRMDARASYHEEKRLWAALGREPPVRPAKVEQPPAPPRIKRTIDELCPAQEDWRRGLRYVSEWELQSLDCPREEAEDGQ